MKAKTKKSTAKNGGKKKSTPRLPTVDVIAARLITIIHRIEEALYHSGYDPMFDTDAYVREQVDAWIKMGVSKSTIGAASQIAMERIQFEEKDKERIRELWAKRILDFKTGNFIKRTPEEVWRHSKEAHSSMDFFEVEPVTPKPENADWWFLSKVFAEKELASYLISDAVREIKERGAQIDRLCDQIAEWEGHEDLALVKMVREHEIPVVLTGPSYENAVNYKRTWDETIKRHCKEERLHPEKHRSAKELGDEVEAVRLRFQKQAVNISEDFNVIVKHARSQTKDPAMLENVISLVKDQAKISKPYAQKLQRTEVARLLKAAEEAGHPITITDASRQLSGTGGMLETMCGYKDVASLDNGVRTHAKDILYEIGTDINKFIKRRPRKYTKAEKPPK